MFYDHFSARSLLAKLGREASYAIDTLEGTIITRYLQLLQNIFNNFLTIFCEESAPNSTKNIKVAHSRTTSPVRPQNIHITNVPETPDPPPPL